MATLADFRNERLRKLDEIRAAGIDPYPAKSHRDTLVGAVTADFDTLENTEVTIAGRITAIRSFGKIAFLRVRDASGEVQIFMKKSDDTPASELNQGQIKWLDTGDII